LALCQRDEPDLNQILPNGFRRGLHRRARGVIPVAISANQVIEALGIERLTPQQFSRNSLQQFPVVFEDFLRFDLRTLEDFFTSTSVSSAVRALQSRCSNPSVRGMTKHPGNLL